MSLFRQKQPGMPESKPEFLSAFIYLKRDKVIPDIETKHC